MSNFMKGFNQGFTPYVGNISDLISNTLMSRAKEQRETDRKFYENQLKQDQERYKQATQERIFNLLSQDPVGNAHLLSKADSNTGARFNQWLSLQPKTKRESREDEGKKYLADVVYDHKGNIISEKPVEGTESYKEVMTKEYSKNGVTRKFKVDSMGREREYYKKIDYDANTKDVEKAKEEEIKEIAELQKMFNRAKKAKETRVIYDKQSDLKAQKASFGDYVEEPDYTKGNIADLDYKNTLSTIETRAELEMSEDGYEVFKKLKENLDKQPNEIDDDYIAPEDFMQLLEDNVDKIPRKDIFLIKNYMDLRG